MLTHASFCNGGASRRPVGVATAPTAYVEGRFRPLQWHGPNPVHDGCSSCARDGMKSTYGCCRTGCVLGRNRGAAPPRALARSRWKMRGQTSACRHGGQVSACSVHHMVRKFLPLKHLASRADCVLHAHESVATAHKTASIPHFRQCACRAAGSLPRGRACGRTVHHTHGWTGRSATRSTRSRVSAGRSPLCDHHVTKTLRSVL
jgi:hypothetical protein